MLQISRASHHHVVEPLRIAIRIADVIPQLRQLEFNFHFRNQPGSEQTIITSIVHK